MKIVKKTTMFLFIFLLCCPPLSVFAAKVSSMDLTDVMDDLEGLELDGNKFDADEYLIRAGDEPELIGMYEYNYGSADYSWYFYVYVPKCYQQGLQAFSGTINIHADSLDNQPISAYIYFNTLDVSDDGFFYKLKFDDLASFLPSVNKYLSNAKTRIYNPSLSVGGRTYDENGKATGYYHVSCGDGGYYSFTGKSATYFASETIDLELHPSMYKTDFSPNGDYHHQMIYTVYFTIPKEYIENYDNLVALEAKWYETLTTPVITSDDDFLIQELNAMAASQELREALERGETCSDFGALFINHVSIPGLYRIFTDYYINFDPYSESGNVYNVLYGSFPMFDHVFKVADLEEDYFIPTVGRYYDTDGDGDGDVKATFLNKTEDGSKSQLKTYTITSDDILKVENRFSGFWDRFFEGYYWNDGKDISASIEPFYYLKDTDMQGYSSAVPNESLFIGEESWSNFYSVYEEASARGDQVVLFRYAVRDYYSAPALYVGGEGFGNCAATIGTAFLDFDIISLTFSKDEETYKFTVDADSIDSVPGIHDPDEPEGLIPNDLGDTFGCENFVSAFKLILGVIFVLIVVILVIKLFSLFVRRKS